MNALAVLVAANLVLAARLSWLIYKNPLGEQTSEAALGLILVSVVSCVGALSLEFLA